MKRIAISILIGMGCSLVVFVLLQLRKNKLSYRSNETLYDAVLKIKIGDVADDKRAITTTLTQIKKRFDSDNDLSAEQQDNNNFLLSIKEVYDSVSVKKLVSESIELNFLETFQITEIQGPLEAVENELSLRRKKTNSADSAGKYEFMLEEVDIETKKKNGTCRLNHLINFFTPFQDPSGKLMYPSPIGRVKTRDTIYLNKLLNDDEIKSKFPMELVFAYGTASDNSRKKDSAVDFYAIKTADPQFYPTPNGDNIEDCKIDFEPMTGLPTIIFKFDAEGSNNWYTMTRRNKGKSIAILMNNYVLTAPVVEEAINGGESRINGDFTYDEAVYLRAVIRSGRLALPVQVLETKFKPAKKTFRTVWMLSLVFLLSALLAYAISFIIKPAPKL